MSFLWGIGCLALSPFAGFAASLAVGGLCYLLMRCLFRGDFLRDIAFWRPIFYFFGGISGFLVSVSFLGLGIHFFNDGNW